MKLPAFEAVIRALHDARVKYLVVGGVAVNAHGYIRFTPDIDLVLELNLDNIRNAFRALATLNYCPTGPVDAEALARRRQSPHGGAAPEAQLSTFDNEDSELTPVNLLAQDVLDFPCEYDQAMRSEILPGVDVPFLSIPALIRIKRSAGRPRDLDDIQHLRWFQEDYSHIDENDEEFLWSMTTFEGARKMQLIRTKKLSTRKRLESLDDLNEVCEHFQKLRHESALKTRTGTRLETPGSKARPPQTD